MCILSFNVIGTGSAYPVKVVTNDDLAGIVDTSDEWVKSRTGIAERRICTTETITDLAFEAATKAIKNAKEYLESIDLIICATISGDYITPSMACILQDRLGLKCPAFDVSAACSGFIYALDIAESYFSRGNVKNVLIVAADALSKVVDWTDRTTCVLFGDGAAAAVLGKGDGLKAIKLSASGNIEALNLPNIRNFVPWIDKPAGNTYFAMNGHDVYKFAVSSMIHDVREVVNMANLSNDEITYVLPHQANMRIIEAAKKRLDIPHDRYYTNIEKFGNMSCVCIPMMLDELNMTGKLKKGDKLVMSAFGGGLTTGACVLEWMI